MGPCPTRFPWKNPGFPRAGADPKGASTYYFGKICRKTSWKRRNLPKFYYVDLPLVSAFFYNIKWLCSRRHVTVPFWQICHWIHEEHNQGGSKSHSFTSPWMKNTYYDTNSFKKFNRQLKEPIVKHVNKTYEAGFFSFFAEPTAMLRKKDDYSSAISFWVKYHVLGCCI